MNPATPTPLSYEDLFAECADALMAGQWTLADCLQRYPEHTDALRQDLALVVALLAERVEAPPLRAETRQRQEAFLRQALQQTLTNAKPAARPLSQSAPRRSVQFMWNRAAAMLALVLFGTLFAGGGVVAASASALPHEPLYSVKRAWESVVLFFASLFGQADDILLHLAQTRLDESLRLEALDLLDPADLEVLDEAFTAAIQRADAQSAPQVLSVVTAILPQLDALPPALSASPQYARLRQTLHIRLDETSGLLTPALAVNVEIPKPSATPSALASPSAVPAVSPTPALSQDAIAVTLTSSALSLTQTAQALSLTQTQQAAFTAPRTLPSATPTSRFAPTATRTPSPVPSATASPTPTLPSATPTLTLTPLGRDTSVPRPSLTPTALIQHIIFTPTPIGFDPESPFVRETQQAAYLTQTAIALTAAATEDSSAP